MSIDPTSLDADWPTLDELSLRYMRRVLAHTRGNKTKAAEMLGIDRRTVTRILGQVAQGRTPTMHTAASLARAPTRAPSSSTAPLANLPPPAGWAGKQTASTTETATTRTTAKKTAARSMR
jgi:hypothetical protein